MGQCVSSATGIFYLCINTSLPIVDSAADCTCGQSYNASTILIYNSRVIPDLKIPHITTLD